jgi:transposase
MPAGRPTKYDPAMCETVIECGEQGMGKLEMCKELRIDYSTFEAYQEKHTEFSQAVKRALQLSQAWWEGKGREATFGGVDGFNATSYIFNMKNRFREDWRDKHDHEVNGNLGVTISRGDSDVL